MYTTSDDMTRALIQVPMILYTAEQIMVGQVLVSLFRRWERREAALLKLEDEERQARESPATLHEGDESQLEKGDTVA